VQHFNEKVDFSGVVEAYDRAWEMDKPYSVDYFR